MSRRQLLALFLANAVVSLVIAVAVVLLAFNLGVERTMIPPTPFVIVAPTAAALPSPPATTATPTVATEDYVVQPGDSLLGIAVRLDVDPALLMALNDITDADRLLVGQRLLVPASSAPVLPTAAVIAPASPPAPRVAETATVSPSLDITSTIAISGAMPVTGTAPVTTTLMPGLPMITAVLAPGDLAAEAISLANPGQAPVRLRNWSLQRPDGRRYMFPDITLAPGGELLIHSRQGADTAGALFWSLRQAAWAPGDEVILADQAGQVVETFVVGE